MKLNVGVRTSWCDKYIVTARTYTKIMKLEKEKKRAKTKREHNRGKIEAIQNVGQIETKGSTRHRCCQQREYEYVYTNSYTCIYA